MRQGHFFEQFDMLLLVLILFRQAAESKIIINSHRVNRGEIFIKKDEAVENNLKEDFFYIPEIDQNKILEQVVSLCNGRLKNYGNFDFFKSIQVIVVILPELIISESTLPGPTDGN